MKNFLNRFFRKWGYVRKLAHPITRKQFFDLYFSQIDPKEFFFVQIGASDGKLADPLYPYVMKYGLAGVAIEPLPEIFRKLQKTYQQYPKVRTRNLAVAEKSGLMRFYSPKSNELSLSTLASLDRESLQKTLRLNMKLGPYANVNEFITSQEVPTTTFADLMQREYVKKVDLLQIDCEGYDWKILQTIDLGLWKPKIINFESALLSEENKRQSRLFLEQTIFL